MTDAILAGQQQCCRRVCLIGFVWHNRQCTLLTLQLKQRPKLAEVANPDCQCRPCCSAQALGSVTLPTV
jgi:hypothetical protein